MPCVRLRQSALTAGASQINDSACCRCDCVISEAVVKFQLKPLARIVSMALVRRDAIVTLRDLVFATTKVFEQAKLTIDQKDLYEVNEAFASVPLAFPESAQG
jgi:acetyl-CoA C-acetyltransferase